jgi:hypothetical protein
MVSWISRSTTDIKSPHQSFARRAHAKQVITWRGLPYPVPSIPFPAWPRRPLARGRIPPSSPPLTFRSRGIATIRFRRIGWLPCHVVDIAAFWTSSQEPSHTGNLPPQSRLSKQNPRKTVPDTFVFLTPLSSRCSTHPAILSTRPNYESRPEWHFQVCNCQLIAHRELNHTLSRWFFASPS